MGKFRLQDAWYVCSLAGGQNENIDKQDKDYQSLLVGVLVAVTSVLLLIVGGCCIGNKGYVFLYLPTVWRLLSSSRQKMGNSCH